MVEQLKVALDSQMAATEQPDRRLLAMRTLVTAVAAQVRPRAVQPLVARQMAARRSAEMQPVAIPVTVAKRQAELEKVEPLRVTPPAETRSAEKLKAD